VIRVFDPHAQNRSAAYLPDQFLFIERALQRFHFKSRFLELRNRDPR